MKKHSTSGFTLLELMVSVAVIALMSVVLSQIFISTLRTNTKTELLKEVKQNGDFALESIARMVQNAYGATCISDKELSILNADGNTTTIECVLDGTTLRLASSSGSLTEYLTSHSVTLGDATCATSTLAFGCEEAVGQRTMVTVSFTLSRVGNAGNVFEEAEEQFQTSAVVRSSVQ